VQEAVNKSVRVVYKELNQEIIAIVRTTTLYTRLHKYMLQVHNYKRMKMVTCRVMMIWFCMHASTGARCLATENKESRHSDQSMMQLAEE
jgi:hypothetical protein